MPFFAPKAAGRPQGILKKIPRTQKSLGRCFRICGMGIARRHSSAGKSGEGSRKAAGIFAVFCLRLPGGGPRGF